LGSMNSLAHARQRYVLLTPALSARTRPRARRSALRQCGQRGARGSMGPGPECATSSTRSLLFSLIDASVVAPGRQGGCGAGRRVVTMAVGLGVEQGGPGPVIPAREAGDLIARDAERSILATRIHGPLHCEGILRARANSVMLHARGGDGMHCRWCSASRMVRGPPRSGKRGGAVLTRAVRASRPPRRWASRSAGAAAARRRGD
jgi:hypothetical protein